MPTAFILYYTLLLTTVILSTVRWKVLQKADRVLPILLAATFASEVFAFVLIKTRGTNFPLHHFFTPIQFLLISLYFNHALKIFRGWVGVLIGVLGLVASVMNTVFIQPISGPNSYFLLFEATAVIIYCLLAFRQILLDEEFLPYRFALFWIAVCFIFYWGVTYMGWGILPFIREQKAQLAKMFDWTVKASNYIFYFGLAVIFLQYRKLVPSDSDAR